MGAGIAGPAHLTVEALAALASARVVFGFEDVASFRPLVEGMGARFERLDYPPLAPRSDIFRRAATAITDAALNSPPVAYLTHGSPVRHVWLTSILRRWAMRERVSFKTVQGPSSLDCILDLLAVDDSDGLQVYDSTRVVLNHVGLNPNAHCLLYNPEKTGTELSPRRIAPRPAMFLPLRDRLLETYPAEHVVSLVVVAGPSISVPRIRTVALRSLECIAHFDALGTLWIPPVGVPNVPAEKVAKLLSLSELVRLAHTPLDAEIAAALRRLLPDLRETRPDALG